MRVAPGGADSRRSYIAKTNLAAMVFVMFGVLCMESVLGAMGMRLLTTGMMVAVMVMTMFFMGMLVTMMAFSMMDKFWR